MIRFFARRLAHAVFILLGVSFLAFVLIDLAPGQYLSEMRLNPQLSPQTLSALASQYGLDQPLPVRYARWLGSVSRGELGFSFVYNTAVWPLIKVRIRNTLILAITALVCSWLLAILIGLWAAVRRGRWEDRLSEFGTSFLLATPNILIGLGLLALGLRVRWFPMGGMNSPAFTELGTFAKLRDIAFHLILPVIALAAATLPILVRHVRSAVLEVLESPFIVAARGHGISARRLLLRHAFPAAVNPLISLFGISVGTLLSGSLLIEVIMSWPGVGPMLLQAILERDPYVVIAAVMFSTLFLVVGNLVSDVMLFAADPRIRRPGIRRPGIRRSSHAA